MNSIMNHRTSFCLAIALLLALPTVSWAVVTSDESGSHTTTPGEEAFGLNVDGVVAIGWEDFPFGSGALITDRYVLTAAHILEPFEGHPFGLLTEDMVVSFDLPSGNIAVPIQSYTVHELWTGDIFADNVHDIAVIELAEDAPAEAPRYPLYGGQDEVGQPMVIVGYGLPGHGAVGADFGAINMAKRAGLNRWEIDTESLSDGFLLPNGLVYDFDSGLPANNALDFEGIISDLGFGDDEVAATFGDSGGPIFLNGAIAGISSTGIAFEASIHADITPEFDGSWGEIMEDTRVSYYRDFLIEATGGQAVIVPEPSTWVLLGLGSLLLVGWRAWNNLASEQ